MCDLDGTLIDSSRLYFEGVPAVVKRFLNRQIAPEALRPFWGRLARDFFAHFAAAAGAPSHCVDEMYAAFEDYYNREHNRLSRIYDTVPESIERLRTAGFKVGVVTTRPTSRSRPVLELPLAHELDFIVWGDQVARPKPAPDGLEQALEAHGLPRAGGIYVGDNANDILAARASRYPVRAAAALWDAIDRPSLMAAGPDLAFENFGAFAQWVLTTWGQDPDRNAAG
jgi:HAD superfamily hydrolase (TIGR01509 family)